jgi:hypothetical protein
MKKLALLAVLVAATAVGAVMVSSALASGPRASDSGFACGVFDENGGIFITTQSSETWYGSGKDALHCIGQSPSGGNGSYVSYNGFACNLLFTGISTSPNNSDTVSKTGESQLWCYGFSTSAPSAASGAAGAIG